MKKFLILSSLIIGVLIANISSSLVLADSITNLPVTSSVSYTFDKYEIKEKEVEAAIEVLKINGLSSKELENKLNKEFASLAQSVYNGFNTKKAEMDRFTMGLDFEIKTDSSKVLSVIATQYDVITSSNLDIINYNVDKKQQKLINLSDLFKDDKYIEVINNNIKEQMRAQMKSDASISYFIDSEDYPDMNFKTIRKDQNFYVNNNGNLVIMFNKYEVAPGSMGVCEFEISSYILQDLVSENSLLKY